MQQQAARKWNFARVPSLGISRNMKPLKFISFYKVLPKLRGMCGISITVVVVTSMKTLQALYLYSKSAFYCIQTLLD